MEKIKTACKRTVKGFAIFVMAFLFAVLFYLFGSGLFNYRDAAFLYSVEKLPVLGGLCGVAVLFFWLFYKVSGDIFSRCGGRMLKWLCFVMVFCALSVQAYFLFYMRSYYKWDSGFVMGAGASLAETGRVAEEAYYYMSVYPNQNTFVLITAALVKIADFFRMGIEARPLLFNLFNTICMDLSVLFIFPILKKIRKNMPFWKQCRILLILLCNPFLYVGVSYYYTITLSLPLTEGFLWLFLSLMDRAGALYGKEERSISWDKDEEEAKGKNGTFWRMLLAGVLLGVGYELRATAIVFAIGAFAVGVWMLIEGRGIKKRLLLILCVTGVTAFVAACGLNAFQKDYVGIDTRDTAFPASHWLMMSLTMPGSHNGGDEAYTASFSTKEEKEGAVMERMKEKLGGMSASDYVLLLKTKLKNTFGTGMNGYTTFLSDAFGTGKIFEWVFGSRRDFTVLWHQGYYLFIMLGILIGLGRFIYRTVRGREIDFGMFLHALILLGAVLFYLLWEASEQYSVPFMMLMCTLGTAGYLDLEADSEGNGIAERTEAAEPETICDNLSAFLAFTAAAFVLIWGICRYETVTKDPAPRSYPSAVQILANDSYPVGEGTQLIQKLKPAGPFNRLVIQWRNPAQENSSAVYRLTLREENGGETVFETEIKGGGTSYNGAGIYDFEEVVPKGIVYELCMEKIAGLPEDDLEFVLYDMYGCQPYPAGKLYLREGEKEREITGSLLFSLSKECKDSYGGRTAYVFFLSLIFLIFLFMGFWCKLRVVFFYGGGKRNA